MADELEVLWGGGREGRLAGEGLEMAAGVRAAAAGEAGAADEGVFGGLAAAPHRVPLGSIGADWSARGARSETVETRPTPDLWGKLTLSSDDSLRGPGAYTALAKGL